MRCPRCGQGNPDGSAFCGGCGSPLKDQSLAPTILGSVAPPGPTPGAAAEGAAFAGSASSVGTILPSSPHPGDPGSQEPLKAGARLGNRYEIVDVLGMGGMGIVYRAKDLTLERDVALKVIRPEMLRYPGILERFRREILLASKVTHRNILRIHDLQESDGLSYLSMNFVEGETLSAILHREGALPIDRVLPLAMQMCEALKAAHDAGVVHRDLKPQNVLVDRDGVPYIADFGLSRSIDASDKMTQTGAILGTIDYMSPEQARGETPDHRGDLYAFGLILYEMLTGTLPFRAESALSVLAKRVHEDAPNIRTQASGIPAWLAAVVSRCLARNVEARYQSAGEILRDLEQQKARMARRRMLRPAFLARLGVVVLGAVLAVVLAAWGVRSLLQERPGAPPPPVRASLVLLPFQNGTGDPRFDWVRGGLPDLLRSGLLPAKALRLAGADRVQETLAALKLEEGGALRADSIQRVAGILGVENSVTGTLLRAGDQFRIEATLQRSGSGSSAPGAPLRVEGQGEEALFGMVDELTRLIRDELGVAEGWRGAGRRSTEGLTRSVEALRLYQEGLALSRVGNHGDAARRLEAAVEKDPAFSLARARLAEAYDRLGYGDKASAAAERASGDLREATTIEGLTVRAISSRMTGALDEAAKAYASICQEIPNSAEAWFDLGSVQEEGGDLEAAATSFGKAVTLDPKYSDAHYALGRVQVKLGKPADGLKEFQATLPLHLESGNEEGRATVLNGMGKAYLALGQYDDALRQFQDSLEIRRRIEDRRGVGVALDNIAVVLMYKGDYQGAIDRAEEAIAIGREIGDQGGLAAWYSDLGDIYQRAGRPEEALRTYQESLKIVRESGNPANLARSLSNVGYINTVLGNYVEAYFFLQEALAKRREIGDKVEIVRSLNDLGVLEQVQGRYEDAVKLNLEGLSLAKEAGFTPGVAVLSANLASIHEEQGDYGAALALLAEAEAEDRKADDTTLLSACLAYLGSTRRQIGDLEGARAALDEAERLARDLGNEPVLAEALVSRSALLLSQGDRTGAGAAARQAADSARASGERRLNLLARLQAARVSGSTAEMEAVLRDSQAVGLAPLVARSRLALAQAHAEAGRWADAVRAAEGGIETATALGARDILFRLRGLAASAQARQGKPAEALRHDVESLGLLDEMLRGLEGAPRQALLARPDVAAFGRDGQERLRTGGRAGDADRLGTLLRP